ncbi:hypothetical protein [Halomonas stenophila]|uniref:Serine/threonine protein kinase HipA of HipAB toxin-antitoxin module n=1 Tax=Halomonas stenophila TaxID=795312 RepID=A0A7W5ESS2_9GAMM|nr:hypothetical protein [Halomonas stenophila]MBB3230793.1 serine/threonine protein kinase HipA of HipAB toxin-antitoxin module [Halomonas stenophila]
MAYHIKTAVRGANPTLEICDISSGSVRMAWEYPRADLAGHEDPELAALRREEAIHELFRRLFLVTTEQYLKGELDAVPRLGAWRRSARGKVDRE